MKANKSTQTTAQAGMRNSITNYRDRDCYVLAISAHPGLSATEKLALIRLAHHVNFKTGRCNPAAATLAKELGKDERWIRRTLAGLERAGLLAIDRTRGRTSNQFTLMVPSMPPNPGQDARVEPGSNSPEPPAPTRVKMVANPGQLAPLTAKNTLHGDVRTSPLKEEVRESASLRSLDASPAVAGAPLTGRATASEERKQAAAEEKKEEKNGADGAPVPHSAALVVPDAFAELRATWTRPWPDHDDREARAAFNEACAKGVDSIHILAAAAAWVEAADAPRFLPKLSDWLTGRCWEREPPKKRGRGDKSRDPKMGRQIFKSRKPDMFRMSLKHGGYVEDEDGGLVWGGQVDDSDDDDALVMGGLVQ